MVDSFSNFLNKIDINSAVSFLFQIHFKVYLRYVFIYPQYCTIFISAEKKHTHTVSDVYFLLRVRIIFGDVFLFIPNIGKFSFVRKKTWRTNRETDKQHFTQIVQRKRVYYKEKRNTVWYPT